MLRDTGPMLRLLAVAASCTVLPTATAGLAGATATLATLGWVTVTCVCAERVGSGTLAAFTRYVPATSPAV